MAEGTSFDRATGSIEASFDRLIGVMVEGFAHIDRRFDETIAMMDAEAARSERSLAHTERMWRKLEKDWG